MAALRDDSPEPTLEDVATLAGVSTATVSRFINSPAIVAPATAQRIGKAIAASGYIPNMLAGGLASRKSRLVAVLIPHLTDSIFNETIERMAEELVASGVNVMLGVTGMTPDRTEQTIISALGRRVDAIISTGPVTDAITRLVRRSKVRFVQMWELPEAPVDIAIGFSHAAVGREIAGYVHARGYCRPHLITANGSRAAQRTQGFISAWQDLGGTPPSEAPVDIPSRFGHARQAFGEIRVLDTMPDVVVCGSDLLAQGLIVEAQFAGLSVPDDLAVIGFGNSPLAGAMRPSITTIDIDGVRIARETIAAIRQDEEPRSTTPIRVDVGFTLIPRESA